MSAKPIGLSKSKLLSFLQCPKRLHLQAFHPENADASEQSERALSIGLEVGELARRVSGEGELISPDNDLAAALRLTQEALRGRDARPLYEATFQHQGVLARLDILKRNGQWLDAVEVKASSQIKEYHVSDCAIQAWVMEGDGFSPRSFALAHIDTRFVYPGDGDYAGLFTEVDITQQVGGLRPAVAQWVRDARAVLSAAEPQVAVGKHCHAPFECPFHAHCLGPQPEYPVALLPYVGKLATALRSEGYDDIRSIPEGRLDKPRHQRVWRATTSGSAEVDPELRKALRGLAYPRYYMDFETLQLAIPFWKGTRPYEQVLFQWSCHLESDAGDLRHFEHLATGIEAPMRPAVEALLRSVGDAGPVLVYGTFEKTILNALAVRYPDLNGVIQTLISRLVDLIPLMRNHYYHPSMKGSWSIKAVLPAICPGLSYRDVGPVQDGGAAQLAYAETLHPQCSEAHRQELRRALLAYCKLDTFAMTRIVSELSKH